MSKTDDGCPFECLDDAEKESVKPFIVMIRMSNEDFESLLSKNVKIVVKDFMLMNIHAVETSDHILNPK